MPTATADDGLGLSRLAARYPVFVETIPWDSFPDWSRYAAVVIRSTWDYHTRLDAFLRWTEAVEAAGAELWNPASVVRWNSDKRYLQELERCGVAVVATAWIRRGSEPDIGEVLQAKGWRTSVVKPSVAATAYRLHRVDAVDAEQGSRVVSEIVQDSDVLVQPFLSEVCDQGEWSFIYFDGGEGMLDLSHAVVKRSRSGDFRVQTQFGGTARLAAAPSALRRQADHVARALVQLAPGPILYARADGVVSGGEHAAKGTFMLMEAELIEPMLFIG